MGLTPTRQTSISHKLTGYDMKFFTLLNEFVCSVHAQFMTAKTKINYKPKWDREGDLGKGTKRLQ